MEVEVVTKRDLDRMHAQLLYKACQLIKIVDTRIMELNSTILDKERQILDLQEMCREQNQVVQARSKAFQIVQQRVIEMDSKKTKDVSTETDVPLTVKEQNSVSINSTNLRRDNLRRLTDSTSPGRAVMLLKADRNSPPPLDPSEDQSSLTTEVLAVDEGEKSFRKQRKKVTFDLKPQRSINIEGLADSVCDDIAQAVTDLTSENDELRSIIFELENDTVASANSRIMQLEDEIEKVRRDGKNQALKAKAAAQGRIRDLEEKIATEQEEYKDEINRLKSTVEALRATREWNVEENARLLEQIAATKQQCDEIKKELSGSLLEQEKLRGDSEKDREMIVRLAGNVEEAQRTVNSLLEQRVSILDDVDRLKEAIEAQDEYIAMLENDVVIYEEHIGLLRDSLGASKVENRVLIKSKAFETKLRALEQEKEQMTKRNNG
uniref:TMF_TATA_bd domain-containing protein n=1 Tax=Syphacia muris TaxID=451379 RepID=A0A0N5AEN7_9BILA